MAGKTAKNFAGEIFAGKILGGKKWRENSWLIF
jgi:hypothetical protein